MPNEWKDLISETAIAVIEPIATNLVRRARQELGDALQEWHDKAKSTTSPFDDLAARLVAEALGFTLQ